jgi:hypothetical protein
MLSLVFVTSCSFGIVGEFFGLGSCVETNTGIESGGIDSFGDFCGRARRIDLFVKESSPILTTNPKTKVAKLRLKPDFSSPTGKKSYSNVSFDAI